MLFEGTEGLSIRKIEKYIFRDCNLSGIKRYISVAIL